MNKIQGIHPSSSSFPPLPKSSPSGLEGKTDQARAQALCTIRANMPITTLFTPELKLNLGTFIQDQMLFQQIAAFLSSLVSPTTTEAVARHFSGSSLLSEIQALFTEGSDKHMPHFYEACADVLNQKENIDRIRASIQGRIFTLKNALLAQLHPSKIIISQKQHNLPQQEASNIVEEGASFLRESLRIHLDALKRSPAGFKEQLTASAEQLIPFVARITRNYLEERNIKIPDNNVLEMRHPQGLNYNGITAAAVMECCLNALGYDTQLVERHDLDPRITQAISHSVVVVKGPDESLYVVDPCYMQFHKDVCLYDSALPTKQVLVLKEDEVSKYVEDYLVKPWTGTHAAFVNNRNDVILQADKKGQSLSHGIVLHKSFPDMFKRSAEDWVRGSLMRIWHIQSYYPLDAHPRYHEIFLGWNQIATKTYTLVKGMGIDSILARQPYQSFQQRLDSIMEDPNRLYRNDAEGLSLITQLPVQMRNKYSRIYAEDQRNRYLNISHEINAYLQSLQKIVNPNHKNLSVIYGCSGADFTSVLAATDGVDFTFVDLCPVSLDKLQEAMKLILEQSRSSQKYLEEKLDNSTYSYRRYSVGGGVSIYQNGQHQMVDIELKILNDLATIGVNINELQMTQVPGGIQLDFSWKSGNSWRYDIDQPAKNRRVTLLHADIAKPELYPDILKKKIKDGFDIFYLKAAYFVPGFYPQFLPIIAKGMRKDGWLMTTDIALNMFRYDPVPCLKQEGLSFVKKSTPAIDEFTKMLHHPRDTLEAFTIMEKTPQKNRSIQTPSGDLSYWIIMNLRQKTE